jgi:hypothetical protein
MHTIGHPTGSGHDAPIHSTLAMRTATLVEPGAGAAQWTADSPGDRMVMNPLSVCLAVLVGGMLLLLAAMLGQLRLTRRPATSVLPLRVQAGRDPPKSVLFGLTLADLSVQRT